RPPSVSDVIKAIRSFPAMSAPGPSGLRPTHLQDALSSDAGARATLLASLQRWFTFSTTNQIPPSHCRWLAAARLLAIPKRLGGIRPIVVGEMMRRLTSKLLVRAILPRLDPALLPLQRGVGVSDACSHTAHEVRHLLQAPHPADAEPRYLLKVDIANAF